MLEPATSLHVSLLLDVRGFTFGIYQGELLELMLSDGKISPDFDDEVLAKSCVTRTTEGEA